MAHLLGTFETIFKGLRQRNERSIRRSTGRDWSVSPSKTVATLHITGSTRVTLYLYCTNTRGVFRGWPWGLSPTLDLWNLLILGGFQAPTGAEVPPPWKKTSKPQHGQIPECAPDQHFTLQPFVPTCTNPPVR